ncbi:MAG: hypothetical protein FWD23_11525 [Oscillospiraceae bacterium]|nr:hypothetical protein [Oscillospiraceae bacterium]
MILEALKVMLFGMLGIFFVMGVILISIRLLGLSQKNKAKETDPENSDE